jgi:hypothetical protein
MCGGWASVWGVSCGHGDLACAARLAEIIDGRVEQRHVFNTVCWPQDCVDSR